MRIEKLPRILSPNLGCPLLTSMDALLEKGVDLILAVPKTEWDETVVRVQAVPSYPEEGGQGFSLRLTEGEELDDDGLPEAFRADVAETRLLISTILRSSIFAGQAQFWRFRVLPEGPFGQGNLRSVGGELRSTLYDLVLYRRGLPVHRTLHSFCLRPRSPEVRFIHLTDLHVAERNDLMAQEVNSSVNPGQHAAPLRFLNFNDRLREFIKEANDLADAGKLDFVLTLGDLIDFVNHGLTQKDSDDNNWQVWIDMVTGGSSEPTSGNTGLRVPVFTTLGNHDWRPFPYPPEFNAQIFGLKKKEMEDFDYLYADTSEAAGRRIAEVHSKLLAEGSPILARSWWGSALGLGLRWLKVAWHRSWTRILALARKSLLGTGTASAGALLALARVFMPKLTQELLQGFYNLIASKYFKIEFVTALVLGVVFAHFLRNWIDEKLREKITALISIESDVNTLRDYFLDVNPYFNYAFRLEDCYFLVMDSGHDALTAQSFWDNGGKKIEHLKIRDNIIGGSPESVGFFPPNENYPYSQISWLEAVLDCVRRTHAQLHGSDRRCRIVLGLHAPPANLSPRSRKRADRLLDRKDRVLLKRGWPGGFDIHYGTLNHYVSEFFYLCLGFRQSAPQASTGPGIDLVLSGHVHWNIDFLLAKPAKTTGAGIWNPEIYYGDFSSHVEQNRGAPNRWWGSLLLQTAACGPPSETCSRNPYYRHIIIDQNLGIRTLRPKSLAGQKERRDEREAEPSRSTPRAG